MKKPGMLSAAYTAFHSYSLGNQALAYLQCVERGIQPGPLNTYPGWQKLGRQVRRGEKGVTLCMPVTGRKRRTLEAKEDGHNENGSGAANLGTIEPTPCKADDSDQYYRRFVYRANWFVLSQTDGEPYEARMPPMEWDKTRALHRLEIWEVPFTNTDGNILGYARGKEYAISPVNPLPAKTMFHELAHIDLGHTAEALVERERTPHNLREVEAESAAYLCIQSLNLPGGEYCRGYITHYLGDNEIPERSAQKVFAAADRILKAGIDHE